MFVTNTAHSTLLNFELRQTGCGEWAFDSDFPIELRGIMDPAEFEEMMKGFSRVYKSDRSISIFLPYPLVRQCQTLVVLLCLRFFAFALLESACFTAYTRL